MADPAYFNVADKVPMILVPGQFFLFTERTLHRSGPNYTQEPLLGLSIRVIVPSVQIKEKFPCILLRGEDRFGLNTHAQPPGSDPTVTQPNLQVESLMTESLRQDLVGKEAVIENRASTRRGLYRLLPSYWRPRLQRATDPTPEKPQLRSQTHQMFNGLGAGNIGDELMLLGFWNGLQPAPGSTIEIWRGDSPVLHWFPQSYQYLPWTDDAACEAMARVAGAVLLVGATPVADYLGLDWPLRALSKRLLFCHAHRLPVHALGVGVDHLSSPEAQKIFAAAFQPMQTWTVRAERSRQALLALGVPGDKVVVGADWAWLYFPTENRRDWAVQQWRCWGVDLDRPLIVANVVNEVWTGVTPAKQVTAAALDHVARQTGAQIAFVCHETRDEEFADADAARTVIALMREPAMLVPNHYYHPAEMIGLLSHADATLSQRYHFTVASILAGTVPVSFARTQKMVELLEDLQVQPVGDMAAVEYATLTAALIESLERRAHWLNHLASRRQHLAARAARNSHFIASLLT